MQGQPLGDRMQAQIYEDARWPTKVPIEDAVAVAAGSAHSCALRRDGAIWCWGLNGGCQVGDGTKTTRARPVAVRGVRNATAVALGGANSLAILGDGSVVEWGNMLGPTSPDVCTPARVAGLPSATAICTSGGFACALASEGEVWCWGDGRRGELGDGTMAVRQEPGRVRF
jgi:alpha-tubulin suppressor-like RCC1 family protein